MRTVVCGLRSGIGCSCVDKIATAADALQRRQRHLLVWLPLLLLLRVWCMWVVSHEFLWLLLWW